MLSPGPRPPLTPAQALALVRGCRARGAILVEGWSDEAALGAVAANEAAMLADRGIVVLPLGGVTNIGKFAGALDTLPTPPRLCGLYDASEEAVALRHLRHAGWSALTTRAAAAAAGFFACERDLEDELIRAAGAEAVECLLAQEDDLASFRRFQRQPEHRGRAVQAQLHRFMGTRAGRKERLAFLVASSLPASRVPAPLRALLRYALAQ